MSEGTANFGLAQANGARRADSVDPSAISRGIDKADLDAMDDILAGGTGEPDADTRIPSMERAARYLGDAALYSAVHRLAQVIEEAEARGARRGEAKEAARARKLEDELAHWQGRWEDATRQPISVVPAQPDGESARVRDELAFANQQIETLHGEIVKLQGENARAVEQLADAMEKADKPKARRRRRKASRR